MGVLDVDRKNITNEDNTHDTICAAVMYVLRMYAYKLGVFFCSDDNVYFVYTRYVN